MWRAMEYRCGRSVRVRRVRLSANTRLGSNPLEEGAFRTRVLNSNNKKMKYIECMTNATAEQGMHVVRLVG